ncbi:hypothetical protein RchiOBHm_Chr6g0255991 [Rosa chinensis]|uniref:Uncharacterized protein n=1 Tax=Rosa chinensis TaxID=74649 RepID=A0A2P6PLZ8_ROSCH|nr:hypothetical protein RchiOBHm_Chr6g0255991 [Rosa chinensis]
MIKLMSKNFELLENSEICICSFCVILGSLFVSISNICHREGLIYLAWPLFLVSLDLVFQFFRFLQLVFLL